jgi:hypothetical protein
MTYYQTLLPSNKELRHLLFARLVVYTPESDASALIKHWGAGRVVVWCADDASQGPFNLEQSRSDLWPSQKHNGEALALFKQTGPDYSKQWHLNLYVEDWKKNCKIKHQMNRKDIVWQTHDRWFSAKKDVPNLAVWKRLPQVGNAGFPGAEHFALRGASTTNPYQGYSRDVK